MSRCGSLTDPDDTVKGQTGAVGHLQSVLQDNVTEIADTTEEDDTDQRDIPRGQVEGVDVDYSHQHCPCPFDSRSQPLMKTLAQVKNQAQAMAV